MEAELVALATAGATTLVQQMATEGWGAVRRRMVSFLARRRGVDEEALEGELEESRADLATAREEGDEEAVADVTAAWKMRLRRLLRDDPAAAAELRALLDELQPRQDRGPAPGVSNSIIGGVHHGPVIQVGTVSGGTIGVPPERPAPR